MCADGRGTGVTGVLTDGPLVAHVRLLLHVVVVAVGEDGEAELHLLQRAEEAPEGLGIADDARIASQRPARIDCTQ